MKFVGADTLSNILFTFKNNLKNVENIIQGLNGTMDLPPTSYVNLRETTIIISKDYDTFKNIGGILKVYRCDGYSFETFIPITENAIYKRTWNDASSTWNTWVQIA